MKSDQIISMAREADAAHDNVVITPFLERFTALVAEHEREECVKQISAVMQDWFREGATAKVYACEYLISLINT